MKNPINPVMLWVVLNLITLGASCRTLGPQPADLLDTTFHEAEVLIGFRIELPEISGLCARPHNDGVEILFVSDSAYRVERRLIDHANEVISLPPYALELRPDQTFPHDRNPSPYYRGDPGGEDSQFEAIACDSSGKIFILSEGRSVVEVFESNSRSALHIQTIHLNVGVGPSNWHKNDDEHRNSRGEGLLLMATGQGHILVLKEKKFPWLLEFGPGPDLVPGIRPVAVDDNTLLSYGEAFPVLPGTDIQYHVLADWEFKTKSLEQLTDYSEAVIAPNKRFLFLSDASRRIACVEDTLKLFNPDADPEDRQDKIKFTAIWELSQKQDDTRLKPEGLAMLPDYRAVVAIDIPRKYDGPDLPNAFILDPIICDAPD